MVRNLLFYEQASREFFSSMYPLHAEGMKEDFLRYPLFCEYVMDASAFVCVRKKLC